MTETLNELGDVISVWLGIRPSTLESEVVSWCLALSSMQLCTLIRMH